LNPFDEPGNPFAELIGIVARLRGEGGCPWDRAQTPQTLRPYVLEEAYEVLDAIDRDDPADLRKELGDVLFQLALLSQMASEAGRFDMVDVLKGINRKMVVRHPHVFDDDYDESVPANGIAAWEKRKAAERSADSSALDGVPQALPGLLRAHRIAEKAGAVGFDWPDASGVRAKLDEELAELDEAMASGDEQAIADELGDVLFTVVNLGRHLPVGAETALRGATAKFEARFRALEAELVRRGIAPHDADADTLEAVWQEVKATC
jgi:MazG family protein